MVNSIHDLSPKVIWQHFYSLTQIPRPSHHEERIQQFMINFGERLELEVERDDLGNVIIRKPASAGCELSPKIIMQGHLDMVPQANEGSTHNFAKDPIQTQIEGEWIKAMGTTLGADNGMGVAAAMAVLSSAGLRHGPIEALFTANEEDGMTGAMGVSAGQLEGEVLLNMDSEEEGVLTVGCAGGVNLSGQIGIQRERLDGDLSAMVIKVRGLKGGHSGVDIHRGRGNANKVIARLLSALGKDDELRLIDFSGGSLRNVIPREARATVAFPGSRNEQMKQLLTDECSVIKKELEWVEPELSVTTELVPLVETGLTVQSTLTVLDMVHTIPNGVIRMSDTMPGLVETSSNLSIVGLSDRVAEFKCLIRSSVNSARDDLCTVHSSLFRLAGGESTAEGAYPGWKPNMDSAVLEVVQEAYRKVFGKDAVIGGIHAGLECGILSGPMPHLDMISFGPTIEFPHSPDERMHIPTVGRFWLLLVETLDRLASTKLG